MKSHPRQMNTSTTSREDTNLDAYMHLRDVMGKNNSPNPEIQRETYKVMQLTVKYNTCLRFEIFTEGILLFG
jgi:hypothetical protein